MSRVAVKIPFFCKLMLFPIIFVLTIDCFAQISTSENDKPNNEQYMIEDEPLGQGWHFFKMFLLSQENDANEDISFYGPSKDNKKACRGSIFAWALAGALLGFLGAAISTEQQYVGPIVGGIAVGIFVWLLTCGGAI